MTQTPNTIFVTGFTGFLGRRLVAELLATRPEQPIIALVRRESLDRARASISSLGAGSRLTLVEGDLLSNGLGLTPATPIHATVSEIFHLAALYDLAATAEAAREANVRGTAHLLAFAAGCPGLQRLHHVSTCYVAGDHRGRFGEEDLSRGQGFLNHYDQTKFESELAVRRHAGPGAVTVYRPAIVVGDSKTGEIAKPDGPYMVMEAMSRLPRWFVFPRVGSGTRPVNLVPVDYVVRALACLSGRPETTGGCYHLADPEPLTAGELQRHLMRLLHRRFLLLPVPSPVLRQVLRPRLIARLMGLPAEAIPYFDYRAWFSTDRAQALLAPHGVSCPRLTDYLPLLVATWQQRRRAGG